MAECATCSGRPSPRPAPWGRPTIGAEVVREPGARRRRAVLRSLADSGDESPERASAEDSDGQRKDVSYQYDTRTPSTEVRKPRIPSVRVRLSLHYRVHSRQILCVGGNELPLGWSFLSIARVPMRWTPGDVWVWEGDFVAGTRVEYKYVVLEEQSWTRLCDLAAEGIVTRTRPTYRQGGKDEFQQPDVEVVSNQMAIVAWQQGQNRTLRIPTIQEIERIKQRVEPGVKERVSGLGPTEMTPADEAPWEELGVDADGTVVIERRDVWGLPPRRPPQMEGLSFGA